MCRTSARNVRAANILANLSDPQQQNYDSEVTGTQFSDVRNLWEGFVGQYKEAYTGDLDADSLDAVGQSSLVGKGKKGVVHSLLDHEATHHLYLDLDNDGFLNVDVADVIEETKDNNPDMDGWRNYRGLPWTTDLVDDYAYLQDIDLYGSYTPVE